MKSTCAFLGKISPIIGNVTFNRRRIPIFQNEPNGRQMVK